MSPLAREVRPAPKPGHVVNEQFALEAVPEGWVLVPPGDAALSRRIRADGASWSVIEPKGRKRFSRGIWVAAERLAVLRAELEGERSDPAWQRRLEAGRARRQVEEAAYAEEFRAAVLEFLAFSPGHAADAARLAELIAAHATPVGSGTVARTERIPVAERAEAATIAWLRHQTTAYDTMHIPLVKGRRREVRRRLAQHSHELLRRYREGVPVDPAQCPLQAALRRASAEGVLPQASG